MPITKAKSRGNFVQLGNYLAQGKEDKDLEWGCSENLEWIHDYENVAKVMTATASRSPNASRIKPTYHLMISYDPADSGKLTKEQKDEIAHRIFKELGFGDGYQYKFVHHNDKNHEHTHGVGNKVHPETLKSLKLSNDFRKLRKIARQIEKEYGLTPTIGKKQEVEVEVDPKDKGFGDRLKGDIDKVISKSGSWAELKKELDIYGFEIQKRGRGAVITDGKEKIKLSYFGRQHSYGRLCERFKEGLDDFENRQKWKERDTFEAKFNWFNQAKDYMNDKELMVEAAWLYEELTEKSQLQRDREDKLGGYKTLTSREYIEGEQLKSKEYVEGDKVINDYQAMKEDLGKYNDAQAAEKALQDLNIDSKEAGDRIKIERLQSLERERQKVPTISNSGR